MALRGFLAFLVVLVVACAAELPLQLIGSTASDKNNLRVVSRDVPVSILPSWC